jgi:hypothetical protein
MALRDLSSLAQWLGVTVATARHRVLRHGRMLRQAHDQTKKPPRSAAFLAEILRVFAFTPQRFNGRIHRRARRPRASD